MAKNYSQMNYHKLKKVYIQRISCLGVEPHSIPKTKKGLVTMLELADTLKLPKTKKTSIQESMKKFYLKTLKESRKNNPYEDRILTG
ncbi:MAG: hypothetical protein WCX73_04485 [Candidatus Pacearchaeota archaeon]|jgi:hypothetical protein